MFLAKVKGNVVSSHKNDQLVGHKLLIVHPIDLEGKFIGVKDQIAVDQLGAGIDDTVLVAKEGAAVQQITGTSNSPIHTIIIAIVDDIDIA